MTMFFGQRAFELLKLKRLGKPIIYNIFSLALLVPSVFLLNTSCAQTKESVRGGLNIIDQS